MLDTNPFSCTFFFYLQVTQTNIFHCKIITFGVYKNEVNYPNKIFPHKRFTFGAYANEVKGELDWKCDLMTMHPSREEWTHAH